MFLKKIICPFISCLLLVSCGGDPNSTDPSSTTDSLQNLIGTVTNAANSAAAAKTSITNATTDMSNTCPPIMIDQSNQIEYKNVPNSLLHRKVSYYLQSVICQTASNSQYQLLATLSLSPSPNQTNANAKAITMQCVTIPANDPNSQAETNFQKFSLGTTTQDDSKCSSQSSSSSNKSNCTKAIAVTYQGQNITSQNAIKCRLVAQ